MWSFLGQGILLGLSAGIAPGPLFALLISETLRHGTKSGLRVALAPLVTDVPIVLVAVLILSRLASIDVALGLISMVGSVVVLQMAVQSLRTKPQASGAHAAEAKSLRRAILVNFLSPHPYLFWLTVGAPTVIKASEGSVFAPWAFVGGFYLCLVGAKLVLAALVGRSKDILRGRAYLYVMRFLGLLLALFALILSRDALAYFGAV